jgi:hypothetical protein
MTKLPPLFSIIFVSLVFVGVTPAFGYGFDFQNCPQQCFIYNHNANTPPIESFPSNWYMDVHMPDGYQQLGVVLSNDNFTAFKNNIAIMAVLNIHTTNQVVNTNYCPLAEYTLIHQDGYAYKTKGLEKYVVPGYCTSKLNPTPVPEFGLVGMILLLTVSMTILFSKRK